MHASRSYSLSTALNAAVCVAAAVSWSAAEPAQPAADLAALTAEIRYQVTAIEHEAEDKVKAFDRIIAKADRLVKQEPKRAEPLLWKGIALAAQAKHKGLGALANVKEARELLNASVKIDPRACGAAGFNALAMLYHRVPPWPVAFGNDKTARIFFVKALATDSNLDTNYRYGEFLIDEGEKANGVELLEKALAFPDRPGRREDPLKKMEIRLLIEKHKVK